MFRFKVTVGLLLFFFLPFFQSGATAREVAFQSDSLTPPYKLKLDANGDGVTDMIGDTVSVTGVATVATGQLHEVYLQIFIQNDTTGLSLFADHTETPIARGDSVVATGVVQMYYGMVEVLVSDYRVYENPTSLPTPVALETAVNNPSRYEGRLVAGEGTVVGKGTRFNGKYLNVAPANSNSQSIMIYVSNFHRQYSDFDFESIRTGDDIAIKGVLTLYSPDNLDERVHKILLRTPDDFKILGIAQSTLILLGISGVILSIVVLGWIISLQSQVKRKTRQIRKSLDEKEVLLKEIHHRVKNNLAIISGLIELQLESSLNEETQKVLRDSQGRIRSMALVHDKLYRTSTLTDIEMKTYVVELVHALESTFSRPDSEIDISFDIDPINLDINKAIPCGLLINELVVNAFKHAFNGTEKNRLRIAIKEQEGVVTLIVQDNGKGIPEEFEKMEKSSLGRMLIRTFAAQLEAEMQVENREGACFTFTFSTEKK